MNFGAKIQNRWFARFRQNSIFEQKYDFRHSVHAFLYYCKTLISVHTNSRGLINQEDKYLVKTNCIFISRQGYEKFTSIPWLGDLEAKIASTSRPFPYPWLPECKGIGSIEPWTWCSRCSSWFWRSWHLSCGPSWGSPEKRKKLRWVNELTYSSLKSAKNYKNQKLKKIVKLQSFWINSNSNSNFNFSFHEKKIVC